MAQIETWYNQDLQQAVKVHYIDGNVFSADNNGNIVGVNVFDGGEPATLGGTVSASIIRADGATVAATGTLSGNKVSVALPQSAYAVPGVISIVLKLTSGTTVTTVLAVVGTVYQSATDTVVDPGTIIPSIETLIAEIEAAVASIPADYSDLWTSLAPAFSSSTAYAVGQYVTYDGGLYRFTSAHAAGSWASGDVVAVTIGTDLQIISETAKITAVSVYTTGDNNINSSGTIVPAANTGLACYYAPVHKGVEYTITTNESDASLVCGFFSTKPHIYSVSYNGARIVQSALNIVAPIDGYIAFRSLSTQTNEAVSYITAVDYAARDGIKSVSVQNEVNANIISEKVSFVTNLVNTSDAETKKVINSEYGDIASLTGYDTSAFIPVYPGTYRAYPQTRKILCYDANKIAIPSTYQGSATTNPTINVPEGAAYVRISYPSGVSGTITLARWSNAEYLPYGVKIFENNIKLSESMKAEIGATSNTTMSVSVVGSTMTIESVFGNGTIKHTYSLEDTVGRNRLPQFYKTEIFDSTGTKIGEKSEDDDITPIRIADGFGTVGANHGYVSVWKITKNGQTSADVGSIWTDGTRQYLLVNTDDTYAYLLAPTGVYSGVIRINTDAPNANLTHVSGATHTSTISIAGFVSGLKQLYPSVNNKKLTVYADGVAISGDYSGAAKEIIIDSEYGIVKYTAIWQYLPNHIGEGISDAISDIVTLKIRTRFSAGGKCTVTTTLIANDAVTLSDCGFLQAQPITITTGQQLWRYINGLQPISGNNFSGFIDISSYNSNLVATTSDLVNNTVPPNRLVDWLISSGNKVFGFTLGYIADKADSSNAERLANCNGRFWDIRSTKKIYPIAVSNITLAAGDSITVAGYRNYLPPSAFVNENVFEYGTELYAGLDDNSSGIKTFSLHGNGTGRSITTVDGTNASVLNDIVSVGVIENLTGAGGCFVKME